MRVRNRLTVMAFVTTAAAIVCCLAYGQTPTQATVIRAERELFASVNQARQSQGFPPLRWDDSLAEAARRHAAIMAEHGSAQHGFEGEPGLSARVKQAGAHFSWLSENVTQGPTSEFIHSQFMQSPSHRANIMDRDMDSVGIGIVEQRGQLFAVEDFSQAR